MPASSRIRSWKLTREKNEHRLPFWPDVDSYVAFARAMVAHSLRDLDAADGQLERMAEHAEVITHLHDVQILDLATRRSLADPRWRNVRWVELQAQSFMVISVIDALAADKGLFRRNRPDVIMRFTMGGEGDVAYVRAAFPELPVASFQLADQLRLHRVDGAIHVDELAPRPQSTLEDVNKRLGQAAENFEFWRVVRMEPPRIVCVRMRKEHAVEVAVAPDDSEFVGALLRALDALDVDSAQAILARLDALIAQGDAEGVRALATEHADHPRIRWIRVARDRYEQAPAAPAVRVLLELAPATWERHAGALIIAAIEHGLLDDARAIAADLTEQDYARWGRLRARAQAARTSGNLALADRFDEIVGRRVSYPID